MYRNGSAEELTCAGPHPRVPSANDDQFSVNLGGYAGEFVDGVACAYSKRPSCIGLAVQMDQMIVKCCVERINIRVTVGGRYGKRVRGSLSGVRLRGRH
jgi:hypothetical protein